MGFLKGLFKAVQNDVPVGLFVPNGGVGAAGIELLKVPGKVPGLTWAPIDVVAPPAFQSCKGTMEDVRELLDGGEIAHRCFCNGFS